MAWSTYILVIILAIISYRWLQPLPFEVVKDVSRLPPPREAIVEKVTPDILQKIQVEDLWFDKLNNMYGGTPDGLLLKFLAPDYKEKVVLQQRNTWALSGIFNPTDGLLYVADPHIGLCSLKIEGDAVVKEKILVHMNFANQVTVGPDGVVYVTNSHSRKNAKFTLMENFYHALFSGESTGQLISFDPKTNDSKVLIDKGALRVANGVAVSPDNKYVYVPSMMETTIGRYSIETGEFDKFWAPLNGYPDNLVTREDGLYGAVIIQSAPMIDVVFHSNWGRQLFPRIPQKPIGDDPCLIFRIPYGSSEPEKYIEIHGMPACNCAVPHGDELYTSSYLLDGAVAKIEKNPFRKETVEMKSE